MSKDKQKLMPWMVKDGESLEVEQLQELSKDWSRETWEAYLSSLEPELEEDLYDNPTSIEKASEDMSKLYPEEWESRVSVKKKTIKQALKSLSPRCSSVIKLEFWKGKTQRQIANQLNISRGSVRSYRKRAFKKIKKYLISKNKNLEND